MAIQYINLGSNPNDGTGDDLRTAFLKVNDNFQLLGSIGLTGLVSNGANLSGGSGSVFAGKNLAGDTLNFRTIAAGSGITINEAANTITIASGYTPPASITKIYDQNNVLYQTTTPNASLKIKGSGFVTTQLNANELTINGAFSVVQDTTPMLGGTLNLNGSNITGLGNISNTGSVTSDALTVGRIITPNVYPGVALVNGTLTVMGASTMGAVTASTINATNTITTPSLTVTSGVITGDLVGDTTGVHYGDVVKKGAGLDPDIVVVNTDTQTITGSHFGSFSGDLTGQLISGGLGLGGQTISGNGKISVTGSLVPGDMALTVNGVFHGGDQQLGELPTLAQGGGGALLTMAQQAFGMSEPLRIRTTSLNSDQVLPLGGGIRFESTNTIDINDPTYPGHTPAQPEFLLHGYMGILNYQRGAASSSNYSSFVVRTRTGETGVPENYLTDSIIARGNGRVSISRTDIFDAVISPKYDEISSGVLGTVPFDLVLKNDASGRYINFYGTYDPSTPDEGRALGGYSFPKTMGLTGQVLTVPGSGNLLTWSTPAGGSGSGVSQFTALIDGPGAFQSTDANKLVAVNATYDALVYTNTISANVTGSLTGNASTATALQNTRTINGFDFNGTQNVTIDTRQIEEYRQQASNVQVNGSGGIPVTSTTIAMWESDLIPVGYNQGAQKFRIGMTVTGTAIVGTVTITNIALSGGSFPVPANDRNVILTVSIEEQIVTTANGVTIFGEVNNQWFNPEKARKSISVISGSALSYNNTTGVLTLNDAVASLPDTLVRRDANNVMFANKIKVTTLEKNTADTAITVASPLVLSSTLNSGANNITTTGTVSAGFITLTGTGNQTIESTAQLILNPGTYVDMSGKRISNLSLAAPVSNSDAATKKYVDDTAGAVQIASLQSISLHGDTGGTLTVAKGTDFTITGSTNISTVTTSTGVQVNLKTTVSGITVSGNLPVTGVVTGNQVRGGNVRLDGNNVTQTVVGSDLNLVPGATGGAVVISNTDLKLVDSKLSMTGYDLMEFAANTLEQQVSLVTQTTFIRTLNWVDDAAGLAYAELPNGSTGQIKIIIMSSRGTYGNALDTRPRYLVLRGNINGSSRSINISASDPNGSATFIFLNNYWWRISNVA